MKALRWVRGLMFAKESADPLRARVMVVFMALLAWGCDAHARDLRLAVSPMMLTAAARSPWKARRRRRHGSAMARRHATQMNPCVAAAVDVVVDSSRRSSTMQSS